MVAAYVIGAVLYGGYTAWLMVRSRQLQGREK